MLILQKTFVAAHLIIVGAWACSPVDATYLIDTVSAGSVQVVETRWKYVMTSPPTRVQDGQTVFGPYRQADLKTHLEGVFRDSSLVFIGRIDTLNHDSTATLEPLIVLAPHFPGTGFGDIRVRARVRVDTLLKGSLPGKSFWIQTHYWNSGLCGTTWNHLVGQRFLNASTGLVGAADIKLPYGLTAAFRPSASWFDGRYLVAPEFPGLRQDITEILPEYPATGLLVSRNPKSRTHPADGKLYRPDGRAVPASSPARRKPSAPLLK